MRPEEKLPQEVEWTMPDGKIVTFTRADLLDGLKIGDAAIREIMRDKGIKQK